MIVDYNRQFTINKAGVSWYFETATSGVTFSNQNGVTTQDDEIITTNINYASEATIVNAIINLIVVDTKGCYHSQPVTIINPCTSSNLSIGNDFIIVFEDGLLKVSANPTGGSGNYAYSWGVGRTFKYGAQYGTSTLEQFTVPTVQNEVLKLYIKLTLTDKELGCTVVKEKTYIYDDVNIPDVDLTLLCSTSPDEYASALIFFDPTEIDLTGDYDPDKLTMVSTNPLVTAESYGSIYQNGGYVAYGLITALQSTGDLTLEYYFERITSATKTPSGTINVTIPTCLTGGGPVTELTTKGNQTIRVLSGAGAGTTYTFNIEGRFSPSVDIDWDTFQVVKSPTQGTVALNAERQLVYTVSSIPENPMVDSIDWVVKDHNGISTKRVTDYVDYNIVTPATVTDFAVDLVIGEASDFIDLATYFTGDFDPNSITISSINADMNYIKAGSQFSFTALSGASSTETLRFKALSTVGQETAEGTITFNCVFAGNLVASTYDLTCKGKIFNLKSFFTGVVGSYQFVQSSTNIDTVPLTDATGLGTVDFTSVADDTYTFTLTATSNAVSDVQEITILKNAAPNITIVGVPTDNDPNASFTLNFSYASIQTNTLTVLVNGSLANLLSSVVYDTLNETGVFTAAYDTDPGSNVVTLTATSICGNLIQTSTTITAP